MAKQTSIVVTACILLMSASLASVWAQTTGAVPNLTGEWAINANNHRSTLTLQHQGNRLTGSVFGVPLAEGAVLANGTVKFIRTGVNQTYTGRFSVAPDGAWKLSGTFHCPIVPPHHNFKWEATRRSTSTTATPGPSDLTAYRNRVGQTFQFQVTGSTSGTVWGAGVYTDDSHLATAAVHAGVLRAGQSGVVTVRIMSGQSSYRGSTANGVTSSNYQAWGGSYQFVGTAGAATPTPTPTTATPGPSHLMNYRNRVGQTFQFQLTGSTSGSVWGAGVYTDDSHLSTAAVHAGVLRAGQSGVVTVRILSGQNSYRGSTANGVTSRDYGRWSGSYQFGGAAGTAGAAGAVVRLEGKVLNPSTGVTVYVGTGFNPSLGASPILEYNTMAARVTPDRDGNWVATVPAGTYDVYISSRGYVPQVWRVRVAPGQVPNSSLGRGSGAHNNSLTLRKRAR